MGSGDLMQTLGLSHRPTFRNNYLNPALEGGWIERTQPDSPRSPTQRYRLTGKGRRWFEPGKITQLENQYTGKAGRSNEPDG
jgi:hypothetical protein